MSLRLRLLLAVGVVALAALVAADAATYRSLSSYLYGRVDSTLDQEHLAIEHGAGGDADARSGFFPGAPGAFVEVRDASGNQIGSPSAAFVPGGQSYTPKLPAQFEHFTSAGRSEEPHTYVTSPSVEKGGPLFRVRVEKLTNGNTLIVATPLTDVQQTLRRLLFVEISVTAGALLAAGVLGWWLVRRGLRPLVEVERTAEAISGGDLDRRVPGESAQTEIGHVAKAFNTMVTRIQAAFAQRDATEAKLRRFVADASHELRTPLAAVSAYAELFDRGASDRPADLSRVMSGIRIETDRMGRLVGDLLLLARLDEGRPLEREPVELVSLANEAIETARAVSTAWTTTLEARGPVEIVGDPARLRQVFDNLLSNVRAHTPSGTSARVAIRREDDTAVIEVADDGPGLSDDDAARVFERFFRADPSRSRKHGGAGLGLGIVAAIVHAHGGTIAASPAPGGGAAFTVRLPIGAIAEDGAGDAPAVAST